MLKYLGWVFFGGVAYYTGYTVAQRVCEKIDNPVYRKKMANKIKKVKDVIVEKTES